MIAGLDLIVGDADNVEAQGGRRWQFRLMTDQAVCGGL
jgi:hypothetical protein